MNIITVAKIKLYTDRASNQAFTDTCLAYSNACNFVSEYAFQSDQLFRSHLNWHKQLYHDVRNRFGLKSQMACSVFSSVKQSYDTLNTQLKNKPYKFKCDGKQYSFKRNLNWLQKPIVFNRPFADLVRGRDWSFVTKNGVTMLSVNTLNKRIIVPYNHHFDDALFNSKLCNAKLLKRKGIWYLHISMTIETDDAIDFKHIVGHDRGLRFIVTSYDGKDTTFINGCDIAKKREKYHRTRKSLQSKNTKSARRVLHRISGRENRWMNDVNHCLSKTLIKEPNTLHIIEDLTDITSERKPKEFSRQLHSWSFFDLEQKLIYKAHLNQSEVIKVPARYTSQRCPKCGCIHKNNRIQKKHRFECVECGYQSNDDRIGAMNLYQLGLNYVQTGKLKGFSKQ